MAAPGPTCSSCGTSGTLSLGQRRVLPFLQKVIAWSPEEISEALGVSIASFRSTLQRARARLAARGVRGIDPDSEMEESLLRGCVDAFELHDIRSLAGRLIREPGLPRTRGPAAVYDPVHAGKPRGRRRVRSRLEAGARGTMEYR